MILFCILGLLVVASLQFDPKSEVIGDQLEVFADGTSLSNFFAEVSRRSPRAVKAISLDDDLSPTYRIAGRVSFKGDDA